MIEDIDIGGIKVQAADLESTPESIKLVLKHLKERIVELEERQNKSSKNSSLPHSKSGFGVKPDGKTKTKKKPLKLTVTRKLSKRKLYEVEECETVHEEKPRSCSSCGYELSGEDPEPQRLKVVDLPELKPLITEYKLHGFGIRSQAGKEFVERMLTVNHSLKSQGRSILDFLIELAIKSPLLIPKVLIITEPKARTLIFL